MWTRLGKGGSRHWGKRGAGFMFTDGKAVLLMKRSEKGDMGGTWAIPGGKVEEGETFLGGAQRETKEETGHMPNCTRMGSFDHQDGRFVFKTFLCHVDKRYDPKLSDEHTDSKWVPLDEVTNMKLHPGLKEIWASVKRTIEEKAGTTDEDLEEGTINTPMQNQSYRAWEMQKSLNEMFGPFGKKPTPPPAPTGPKHYGPATFGPELKAFAAQVATDLDLPNPMPPKVETALLSILARLTPPPVGWEQGGILRVAWFETICDAVAANHIKKNGGKFNPHAPEVRDADNPLQLLYTLRTHLAQWGDQVNPKASLEGAKNGGPDEHDAFFTAKSNGYNVSRNVPAATSPATPAAPAGSPPGTPPAPPGAPGAPGAPPAGGPAGATPPAASTLEDFLDKMPDAVFKDGANLKPLADVIHTIQAIATALGESPMTVKQVRAYMKKRGLTP